MNKKIILIVGITLVALLSGGFIVYKTLNKMNKIENDNKIISTNTNSADLTSKIYRNNDKNIKISYNTKDYSTQDECIAGPTVFQDKIILSIQNKELSLCIFKINNQDFEKYSHINKEVSGIVITKNKFNIANLNFDEEFSNEMSGEYYNYWSGSINKENDHILMYGSENPLESDAGQLSINQTLISNAIYSINEIDVSKTNNVLEKDIQDLKTVLENNFKNSIKELNGKYDIKIFNQNGNYISAGVYEVKEEIQKESEDDFNGFVGYTFYAYKDVDGWKIVLAGQDSPMCVDVDKYNFPSNIVDHCWEADKKTWRDRTK